MAFIGEIQLFAFGYAPPSWQLCNGSLLQVRLYPSLFALIGTSYGGNGTDNFRVPNLVGRAACSAGQGGGLTPRTLGIPFGAAQVTLTEDTAPSHTHGLGFYAVIKDGDTANLPQDNYSLTSPAASIFVDATAEVDMKNQISRQGDSAPHENRQPYLGMAYYILVDSREGVYPTFA